MNRNQRVEAAPYFIVRKQKFKMHEDHLYLFLCGMDHPAVIPISLKNYNLSNGIASRNLCYHHHLEVSF